jgi:uncharacterized membrane protein
VNLTAWIHFVHILGAIVWVGGGVMLLLIGARARSSNDPHAILEFARILGYVGLRALMPAVIVVLVTGVWMVLDSSAWHFSQLWVRLALTLFGLAFLIGAVFLSRIGIQMQRALDAGASGLADGETLVRRWMVGYGVVLVILVVAVWDMVFKPGM